jgi:putative oxidoreductase
MELDHKILKSSSDKQPVWLTLVRVILGFILFWKGIQFIQDMSRLESMLQNSGFHLLDKNTKVLTFIIPYISLLGGLFIASGLFTRWTALVQIPILAGAIVFANMQGGMTFSNNGLILSIVTFILLIVFVIKGSGNFSADEFFRTYYKAGTENGYTQNFFR